ncbi:hypothetical protein BC828DRAFT_385786 [Blastocladiella britannica]|nr:hypothetical protein BC828DRAFT_385786 [Blastocladiella britannica]
MSPQIHVRHGPPPPASASRSLVSAPTLAAMALGWVASLIAVPLLIWSGLLLPALLATGLAVSIPLGAGLVVSGFAIHRRVAHSLDAIVRLLLAASSIATPLARWVAQSRPLAFAATALLKMTFFSWFSGLVLADRVLRHALGKLAGRHVATDTAFSLVNAADPSFQPAGIFSDTVDADLDLPAPTSTGADADDALTSEQLLRAQGIPFRPKTAYSLSVAAKLAYEDLVVMRHELEAAGFDLETFTPIHYRNTAGYVVAKGRTIIVVFRGTKPLNAANIITDIRHTMAPAAEPFSDSDLGNVHEGFLEALGPVESFNEDDPDLVPFDVGSPPTGPPRHAGSVNGNRRYSISTRTLTSSRQSRTIKLELHTHSLTSVVISSVRALATVGELLLRQIAKYINDPIERFTHIDNRDESAYVQAHRGIAHAVSVLRVRESLGGVVSSHDRALAERSTDVRPRAWSAGTIASVGSHTDAGDKPAISDGTNSSEDGDDVVIFRHRDEDALATGPEAIGDSDVDVSHDDSDSSSGHGSSSDSDEDDLTGPIRLYVTGHSLGGAIAHVFLAKLTERESAFLEFFDGLYTFGSPRVGDDGFQRFLESKYDAMFRIVYNKDIVPRVPPIDPYAELPGHLVTLSPLGKMVFRPPGTITRPVNFISPSGLLSPTVIFQLRNESFLRFIYRVLLPFYVNDHMPSDYSLALQKYAY